jgi:hypothetical protein
MSIRALSSLVVLIGLLVPASAFGQPQRVDGAQPAPGQPQPPPPPPPAPTEQVRDGLTFGVGLGVGSLRADCPDDGCSAAGEAVGIEGHIGWMLAPRFALMLDVWTMFHVEGFLTVYQVVNTVAAQYWLTPAIWIKGGVGNAVAGYNWRGIFAQREDKTEAAPGVMFGVGWELVSKKNRVLDLHFKYGTGFYNAEVANEYVVEGHSIQVGASINFY